MNVHSHRERQPHALRRKVKTLVREELLAAAEEVFAQQGLQAAKVEDIAARAGVAVGTVYNYFEDRKALLSAVTDQTRDDFSRKLRQIEEASRGRPFPDRLAAFLDGMLGHFDAKRRFYMILAQAECTPLPRRHGPAREGLLADAYRQAERLFAGGIASGDLRAEKPGLLAAALVGMIRGVAFRALLDPSLPSLAGERDALVALFLRGASR